MIIRLDEREKNLSTTFSATPPPPNIKLCIWSYIGERERQRNTHRQRDKDRDRSMNWLSPGDPIRELQEISSTVSSFEEN
jgi:hypothetical protein